MLSQHPSEWQDSDGDGCGDNQDIWPFDPEECFDRDVDGVGDNADAFPIIGLSGAMQMETDLVITVIYFLMIRWQNMTPTAMELLTITMRFLTIQIWIIGLI